MDAKLLTFIKVTSSFVCEKHWCIHEGLLFHFTPYKMPLQTIKGGRGHWRQRTEHKTRKTRGCIKIVKVRSKERRRSVVRGPVRVARKAFSACFYDPNTARRLPSTTCFVRCLQCLLSSSIGITAALAGQVACPSPSVRLFCPCRSSMQPKHRKPCPTWCNW